MKKVGLLLLIVMCTSLVYAQGFGNDDPTLPHIIARTPSSCLCSLVNASFNETYLGGIFWKRDGSNSPSTGNWTIGQQYTLFTNTVAAFDNYPTRITLDGDEIQFTISGVLNKYIFDAEALGLRVPISPQDATVNDTLDIGGTFGFIFRHIWARTLFVTNATLASGKICNATACFTLTELNTTGSGSGGGSSDNATVEQFDKVLRSPLTETGTVALNNENMSYFVYVGRVLKNVTVKNIAFHVTTAGVDPDGVWWTGIFSSQSAPNRTAQTLTRLANLSCGQASGDCDAWNTAGVKRAPISYNVTAGTYLWAGISMGTSDPVKPVVAGLARDWYEGYVFTNISNEYYYGSAVLRNNFTTNFVNGNSTGTVVPILRVELN